MEESRFATRPAVQGKEEFELLLSACTEAEIRMVYEEELGARRPGFLRIISIEAARRGIELMKPA